MNIILGREQALAAESKYVVLELDTFRLSPDADPITAYGLIEMFSLEELPKVENLRELHRNLMKNYRLQNWKFCEDAIEHLVDSWGGELKSFYQELSQRISGFKKNGTEKNWDGVISKYHD